MMYTLENVHVLKIGANYWRGLQNRVEIRIETLLFISLSHTLDVNHNYTTLTTYRLQ